MTGDIVVYFYRICCFGVFYGLVRLAVPNKFKGISGAAFEIMLLLILMGPVKNSILERDIGEYVSASYNFENSYKELEADYIKGEIEELIKEKLKSEGIIPKAIGIDIIIEGNETKINGCSVELYESQQELFMKKKEKLQKELGISFYEKGE